MAGYHLAENQNQLWEQDCLGGDIYCEPLCEFTYLLIRLFSQAVKTLAFHASNGGFDSPKSYQSVVYGLEGKLRINAIKNKQSNPHLYTGVSQW